MALLFILATASIPAILTVLLVLSFKYGKYPWEMHQYKTVGSLWIALGIMYVLQHLFGVMLGARVKWWAVFVLILAGFLSWYHFKRAEINKPLK